MVESRKTNIPNFLKFMLLVICFLPFVFFIAKKNHKEIEFFEASGKVVDIDWSSRDHGMPVITIKDGHQLRQFKSNRITLNSNDISVGDDFVKVADSRECRINNKLIRCIN